MKGRALPLGVLLALVAGLLSGCEKAPEQAQSTLFAMDTVMTLTVYGDGTSCTGQESLDRNSRLIGQREAELSSTRMESPIYTLNQQGRGELSGDTAELLTSALELCRITGGALDVTAYPAVQAWGFISGDYRVPGAEELSELAENIDYRKVALEAETGMVELPAGVELDLGAVAKGALGDELRVLFQQDGIASALLDLGQSTIVTIGTKPDGTPWRIGVQDPEGEGYLGVLELAGLAVGTSGGYQRYFEQDGQTYWHIIDPATAAPARSGLSSVTVVSSSAFVCDGLSTALFVMGLEDGARFWRAHPELEFEAVFVTENGGIALTAGLEERFTLGRGYEQREVTVIS